MGLGGAGSERHLGWDGWDNLSQDAAGNLGTVIMKRDPEPGIPPPKPVFEVAPKNPRKAVFSDLESIGLCSFQMEVA